MKSILGAYKTSMKFNALPKNTLLIFIHSMHYTEHSVSLFLDLMHGLQQCITTGHVSISLTGRIYIVTAQINGSWTLKSNAHAPT